MSVNSGDPATVTISARGAERIRAGHVWVYRSDVVEAMSAVPGSLVAVQTLPDRNARPTQVASQNAPEKSGRPARSSLPRPLGSAFYSSASQIALRMISPHPVGDLQQLLRERIRAALAY